MEKQHPLEYQFLQQGKAYSIRIARLEEMSVEKTFDGFKDLWTRVIVSDEVSTKGVEHQHVFLHSDKSFTKEDVTTQLQAIYPLCKGNKCFSTKVVVHLSKCIQYTVKEGSFKSQGFSAEFIKDASFLSYPKLDVKAKMSELEDEYLLHRINLDEFMMKHINLKVKHGQNLYDNHLVAYMKRMAIRSGDMEVESYCDEIRGRIFNVDRRVLDNSDYNKKHQNRTIVKTDRDNDDLECLF